jgi:hypothetical protein
MQSWALNISDVRLPQLAMDPPELRPEIFIRRIQLRIARNHATGVGPGFCFRDQSSPRRICRDIKTDFRQSVPLPLFFPQHFILRLGLKLCGRQLRLHVSAEKSHAINLIGVVPQTQPDQMQVVGHQAVNRAKQFLARSRVQQQFAKPLMKVRGQPTFRPVENRQGPEHSGVGLIMFARQSRQGKRPVQRVARCFDRLLSWHGAEIRDSLRRLRQVIFAGVGWQDSKIKTFQTETRRKLETPHVVSYAQNFL